jgi:hypothetical protein
VHIAGSRLGQNMTWITKKRSRAAAQMGPKTFSFVVVPAIVASVTATTKIFCEK